MQAMSEAETGSEHQRGSDVPNASLRPPPMNKRRQAPTLSNSQYHHFNYADPLILFTAASHRLSQSCSIPREVSNARGYRQPCLANPHAIRRIKQLCTFPFHIKSRCRGLYGTVRVSFVTQQQFFIISTCYTTALAATGQSRDYGFYPLVFPPHASQPGSTSKSLPFAACGSWRACNSTLSARLPATYCLFKPCLARWWRTFRLTRIYLMHVELKHLVIKTMGSDTSNTAHNSTIGHN